MQVKLRKYQNNLAAGGLAVIAFGLWSLIKSVVFLVVNPAGFNAGSGISQDEATDPIFLIIEIFLLVLLFSIDIGLRLIVGFNARAHAHGKQRSLAYVIVAMIMGLLTAVSFLFYLEQVIAGLNGEGYFDIAVNIMVELTSLLAFVDVIVSAFAVRRLQTGQDR